MTFIEIVALIGFILGSILHTVLSIFIVQRKNKKGSELVFLFLVISVAVWHYGNAISLFSIMLFGKNIPIINQLSSDFAYMGMGVMPSLLLHTAILFLLESGRKIKKKTMITIITIIYLPVIPFTLTATRIIFFEEDHVLTSMAPFVKPFIIWLLFSIFASAVISRILSAKVEEVEEQKFHFSIFWILIFITILVTFTVLLEGRNLPYVGEYMVLATMLSSIFPSIIFSYYVYRYNYMEFVLRRSVFYSFLAILVICFYYFGIRQLGKYLEFNYSVNAKVLEAVLIIALVYWFPKLKENIQGLIRRLFFKRIADSEYLLNDLSHQISTDLLIDLSLLLENVVESIEKATAIKDVNLILFKGGSTQVVGGGENTLIARDDIPNTIKYFDKGEIVVLDRHEITDASIINEMKRLEMFFVFPIFKDRKLTGLLTLGKPRRRMRLPTDSLEQLMIIANQISSAMAKAELIQEKLQLERKMYENEKLSSLGRLSTSVAHEVKNPLSSIKAIVQVLKEDSQNKTKTQKSLSIIVEEIDRLTKVVNQLLVFAKPQGDSKANVKISDLINKVLVVLRHEAKMNNVDIHLEVLNNPPLVMADEGSLTEVFFNIIHNAIQAMSEGGKLTIQVTYEQKDDYIRVVFEDNGPGISQEDIGKIFEPFYTTKQMGTGLGLAIVKKKLEEVRGLIHVESEDSTTRFIVNIPSSESVLVSNI
ncbi:MAG: Adaptive-response sensory-kinase SasA [Candidatus Scalindua arabica]|uniref:histidine kinase n=1 Tax=Candidatus Scalindua arabica TaxID=1127984 RepID=A0A941W2C2_9BACT|nr:Adaptive-response sensory-kinase SasA [Candidatus Scalindua arabica]